MTSETKKRQTNFDKVTANVDALAARMSRYRTCWFCAYKPDGEDRICHKYEADEDWACLRGIAEWLETEVK